MSDYRPTIGLEVHAELKTATKMFCNCANAPDERTPNKHICPVCMAHPGTLPVINRDAVAKVLLVGQAIGATLADYSEFDRKSYFYPDIPKGYQVSQFAYPLVAGGVLHNTAITRIHLEEDTARSQHTSSLDTGGEGVSLVDYNRAGVPLMELVTEPVIHTPEDAGAFARELQLLLRYLGAGEANMEKGEMRVEANISVQRSASDLLDVSVLGTKVEVKNLNSFRSVERAIAFEVARQVALLEAGGQVVQETRGWDEAKQMTYSQRKKESSHDYRHFPEPDLPKLRISEIASFASEVLDVALPELPWERRARYLGLGLKVDDADMFVRDNTFGDFFDAVVAAAPDMALLAANFIVNDIAGEQKKRIGWFPSVEHFVAVVQAYSSGALSSPQAKSSLISGTMAQVSSVDLLPELAAQIIAAQPSVVADYKAGKEAALQFLVGQGMKASQGSANPEVLREVFKKLLA